MKVWQESRASGRVLLAENDPTARLVLTRLLRRAGYEVVVVSHGAEALDLLEGRSAYDLVTTESRMPQLSGPELVRILRGPRRSAIPVVVLSGASPDPGQINEWQRLGGVSWMLKPFDCRALLIVLAEALGEPTPEAKSWRT